MVSCCSALSPRSQRKLVSYFTILAYPLARYFEAFDFAVATPGYCFFNEIVSFGMPSILVPDPNDGADGQQVRTAFADRAGAAVNLDREAQPMLEGILGVLLEETHRQSFRERCKLLSRHNGAGNAAALVAGLCGFEIGDA